MLNKIKEEGIVAVIRTKNHEEAIGYINACVNGGVKAIELTYTSIYISYGDRKSTRLNSSHW